jgi:hypothetical protein
MLSINQIREAQYRALKRLRKISELINSAEEISDAMLLQYRYTVKYINAQTSALRALERAVGALYHITNYKP